MVQLAKLDSWFGGELVRQYPVGILVGRERLGLTAIAVKSEHQQRVEALPERINGDMLPQFTDHLGLPTQVNGGIDLRDDDEYRAITRETIIRGLAGTIDYTPATITVTLEPPRSRRVARALTLLTDEINATPPHMPGDTRPITYQLTPKLGI